MCMECICGFPEQTYMILMDFLSACLQTAGKDRSYKPLDHVDHHQHQQSLIDDKSPSDTKSSISGYESENEMPLDNNNRTDDGISPKKGGDAKEVKKLL